MTDSKPKKNLKQGLGFWIMFIALAAIAGYLSYNSCVVRKLIGAPRSGASQIAAQSGSAKSCLIP